MIADPRMEVWDPSVANPKWKHAVDHAFDEEDRFLRRLEEDFGGQEGCWEWAGKRTRLGYGLAAAITKGGSRLAHRIAYECYFGPIPKGLTLDHICRNPPCLNPSHLEAVPLKVNLLRGVSPAAKNARKTHCKRGHPLSGDNLYAHAKGYRNCRACNNMRSRSRANQEHQRKWRHGRREAKRVYDQNRRKAAKALEAA